MHVLGPGTAAGYPGARLADEVAAIERIGTFLKAKAGFISEMRRSSAHPLVGGTRTIVAHYRAPFPSRLDLSIAQDIGDAAAVPLLEGR